MVAKVWSKDERLRLGVSLDPGTLAMPTKEAPATVGSRDGKCHFSARFSQDLLLPPARTSIWGNYVRSADPCSFLKMN